MEPSLRHILQHAGQAQRVVFLNALRKILEPAAPRNRAGSPVISDFDMLRTSHEQHCQAAQQAGLLDPHPAMRDAQLEAAALTEADLEHDLAWDRQLEEDAASGKLDKLHRKLQADDAPCQHERIAAIICSRCGVRLQ